MDTTTARFTHFFLMWPLFPPALSKQSRGLAWSTNQQWLGRGGGSRKTQDGIYFAIPNLRLIVRSLDQIIISVLALPEKVFSFHVYITT